MELNDFPNEVLSTIFSHLSTKRDKHCLDSRYFPRVWPIRLVCRRWNDIATAQLFHTLTLHHTLRAKEEDFSSWHSLLETDAIRAAVRRVAIESSPWSPWRQPGDKYDDYLTDKRPEFASAINRICDLPHLDVLEVRFSRFCAGRHTVRHKGNIEPSTTRARTLKTVLKAMRRRAARPDTTVIRELVLDHLQNMPLPKDLTDGLLENIERLHLQIADELTMTPEDRAHLCEWHEYHPYLQNTLLPPVAEQLVELTISGNQTWGAIPGQFNGKGLHFPRLKTLTLAQYVIARQDQFEWVLSLESLTSLRLHSCSIATHILVLQPDFARWKIDMRDWKRVTDRPMVQTYDEPRSRYKKNPDEHYLTPGYYLHPLRWDVMFESIRERLPHLQEFRFTKEDWDLFFRHASTSLGLVSDRYIGFGKYWCPLRDYNVAASHYIEENRWGEPKKLLEITEEADRRALERLLETTRERRMTARPV
ncbi:hypothetical protein N0V84_001471 [Fusarium piperis]|uniref:F-box domain-containing protein n=1 Tax=Fusarium piperis TaxID=1435070 RepID=A0A9W8WKY2_9HYPO|nr:hypothetical protein N0V84_001471 [Fusarium piperis]